MGGQPEPWGQYSRTGGSPSATESCNTRFVWFACAAAHANHTKRVLQNRLPTINSLLRLLESVVGLHDGELFQNFDALQSLFHSCIRAHKVDILVEV